MRRPRVAVAAAALAMTLLAGCSSGPERAAPALGSTPVASPVPGAEWEKASPESVGLDGAALERIAARAEKAASSCFLVVRDGKIAGEWYFGNGGENVAMDVFSVSKSVTSTMVGIARDDGKLTLDDRASRWIPEWRGTPSEGVTVRNLVSNDSGRHWSALVDYGDLIRAPNKTAFAIGLGQDAPPGTVWAYNNSAIQTLEQVLQGATGKQVGELAKDRLFGPLGMTNTTWTADAATNTMTFMGVRSTCRDMARFGVLALNDGQWGDRRIVSASWLNEATGRSSTKLNAAYGYLWWLNHEGIVGSPRAASSAADAAHPTTARGRLVAGAPDDMFWAIGLANQIVQVDPGTRTVVVRLAPSRGQDEAFGPAATSAVVREAVTRR